MLGIVVEFQKAANDIKEIQKSSGGTFFGDFMLKAKSDAQQIVSETEKLRNEALNGIEPALLAALALACMDDLRVARGNLAFLADWSGAGMYSAFDRGLFMPLALM
ncbi:hypothetical protein [Rhizobium leguminosarum]|uniref:hypothetical protein n=1 Tax=Rhizobium leguminosarum TaxID=384 RepID=UPI001C91C83B|nr:hypothetical protein [Rhizobium leguminosarum]MBY2919466.1 hypothetical protein [Rhizobium leguminosarum]MBY2975073.1 hypothetical protein [Rhizobium leguminosarum]MBY2981806.1 hypothetical protein [Rhizobium leguminosarum]MBY3011021.1 hypothetical protein [Rhizobium leguminosarum]